MITSAQARQYLDQALGITVPDFIADAVVTEVATAEASMDAAGYSASKKVMVQSMAVAIKASAGSARRIQSQGAPSGASRSFKNDDKALTLMRRDLAALDTAGTVSALIGPDPNGSTIFMVVC